MLFGCQYYPEYLPYERLDQDLELMRAANVNFIRVGESTWSTYEPTEGNIDFSDLIRVVDRAHESGIRVVVGTTSYSVPPWLAKTYPEVMARVPHLGDLGYGARQNVNFTSPAYRYFAQRIIERMADAFGHHPGVVGFQVDNEIGKYQLANPNVIGLFREHLLKKFGSVEKINAEWGLTFWSHRLTDINELWLPENNTNFGYALEWERFQALLCTEFLCWQRDIIRPRVAPDKFITHPLIAGTAVRSADVRAVTEEMDHSAVTMYFAMQEALERPGPATLTPPSGKAQEWSHMHGAWGAFWRSDLAYSLKGPRGEPFLVLETGSSPIGFSFQNAPPFPGQLRLTAYAYLARGAQLISYWNWHTLHFDIEGFWGGLLGHDLSPNRIYGEIAQLGKELGSLAEVTSSLAPEADVALLYSRDSFKGLEAQPCFSNEDGVTGDERSYLRVFNACYRAAFDERLQVRIVHPDSDWTGEKILVVPALFIAEDGLLDRIVSHAEAGAHVILTFRSGIANEHAIIRHERQPARMRRAVGASYQEYQNLRAPVRLRSIPAPADRALPPLALPADASGTGWADFLVPEGADILCNYDDRFLGSYAAVTTMECGKGRVTWLGTLPDRETMGAIVDWAAAERGITRTLSPWDTLPEAVNVSSAVVGPHRRIWFVSNYGWDPVEVAMPEGCKLLVGPTAKDNADAVSLGPWDCCVLEAGS